LPWWLRVIYDYDRLRLFARENKSDDPPYERKAKKDVEYDNSRGVRAFSFDGHDRG
jgi:hypothetical protein